MNLWMNGRAHPKEISGELLTVVAAQVDRQLVLELGGEFLDGSDLRAKSPRQGFEQEGASNG
jgi:hypothetical protein